jgi:hypothetical protein
VLNNAAQIKKKFDKNTRSNQVQKAAAHLIEALEMQRELKTCKSHNCLNADHHVLANNLLSIWAKRNGNYLSALYLFTKLLYVLNVLLQFVILDAFLGPEYTFWGYGVLKDIWNGRQWTESGHFPVSSFVSCFKNNFLFQRVTLCDFNVRVLGNIHRWTVQCVLMVNLLLYLG